MSSDNPVADRLLNNARKKSARAENPVLAIAALVAGVLGVLIAYWVPLAGWILGALAVGLAVPGIKHPGTAKQAQLAAAIGVLAILLGVFSFTLHIA